MKKIRFGFLLFLLTFCLPEVFAQQVMLPQNSPAASVSQTIGLTKITVSYHAPGVKGRTVWGNLVPYGKLWRAGANEATLISFEDNVMVNNEPVYAGKYPFFILPESDSVWYVVLNNDTTLWGTENYSELKDFTRITVKPQAAPFSETLQYSFNNISEDAGMLQLAWGDKSVSVKIKADVETKAMANMKKALDEKPNDWFLLSQCADYLIRKNIKHEQALEWLNKSIALKENFYNNWLKAQLLAKHNEFKEAANLSKKAIALGPEDPELYKTFADQIERSHKEWKRLRN